MQTEQNTVAHTVTPLLEVTDLVFGVAGKVTVGPISFSIGPGEAVGVVGESGAGKSLLCRALTGMISYHGGRIESGSITYDSRVITDGRQSDWGSVRRSGIGFVPQASLSGLNPMRKVGAHFKEVLTRNAEDRAQGWHARAVELLEQVQLNDPKRVLGQYGHQLSGGMQQRVMLALTLATRPRLLIADEPTTALDATVAKEILRVLRRLREEEGLAVIVVSHDLGVIEQVCDRVHVMYAGRVVESGATDAVLGRPLHPYSAGLLATDPSAVPFGQALTPIPGEPPAAREWARSECSFAARCPHARPQCLATEPPAEPSPHGGEVACIRWREIQGEVGA
ncbi:ABC transporter ATP-binding protein [Subtercola sp. YIM 133946]|uniref:ABC transporter ATP-binding protein n=1 Tax=Subtercola sp. YIM 133946 TaxID=3118909 RepID=UPI002F93DB64